MNKHRRLENDLWGDSEDDPPDHVVDRFIARHEHDPELATHKPRPARSKRKAANSPDDADRNPRS